MADRKPFILNASTQTLPNRPMSRHSVEFYRSETDLLPNLSKFIVSGIGQGESCIIIATKPHSVKFRKAISQAGIKCLSAERSGHLLILDAQQTLNQFMVNGLPDREKFYKSVGAIISEQSSKSNGLRAFGEMVALLWKAGNKKAVIQLESLWEELGNYYPFNLYCAYPELHFVMDVEARLEISHLHDSI